VSEISLGFSFVTGECERVTAVAVFRRLIDGDSHAYGPEMEEVGRGRGWCIVVG
jgi:hypothetical protein